MKKLVFAIQVFGVIAMFPFIMILELNRSEVNYFESNKKSIIKQRTEMETICLLGNMKNKLKKDVFPAIVETIFIQALKN